MKLYYAPGTCAIGIHLLLEEVGASFETEAVNLRAGDQYKPEFLKINPKSKVPALQFDDGSILTEWPAIAYYVASEHPGAALLSEDKRTAAHALETINFINGHMHMVGFGRLFTPGNFAPSEADQAAVKAKGLEIIAQGFDSVGAILGTEDYLYGDFSIADAALFYVSFWATRLKLTMPENIAAHYTRVTTRPAVAKVLKAEGFN